MESPCKCGIEPPGSISHGVSYNSGEKLQLETVNEGCVTSHRLKSGPLSPNGGPLPPNEVGRIAQHISKEGKNGVKFSK